MKELNIIEQLSAYTGMSISESSEEMNKKIKSEIEALNG